MTKRAFVLLALSTATAAADPAVPLCDHDGAPACGNIGQTGRPHREVRVAAARPVLPMVAEQIPMFAVPARALLVAAHFALSMVARRPLVDSERQPMCGNVMGKGGHKSCR
jgi:hypothetical protein